MLIVLKNRSSVNGTTNVENSLKICFGKLIQIRKNIVDEIEEVICFSLDVNYEEKSHGTKHILFRKQNEFNWAFLEGRIDG